MINLFCYIHFIPVASDIKWDFCVISRTLMRISASTRRYHYYNPFLSERARHLFAIPRCCGYELNIQPTDYMLEGGKRGKMPRALWQYTISGRGMLEVNGEMHELNSGDAFLIVRPDDGDYKYYLPQDSEKWEFLFISFDSAEAQQMVLSMRSECGTVFKLDPDGPALSTAWRIYELFKTQDLSDKHAASRAGYDLLMNICSEVTSSGRRASRREFINLVYNYCLKNMHRRISIQELAELTGYSRSHFSKEFHRTQGISPSDFLIRLKLDTAMRLLKEGKMPVKEVAAKCGFDDVGYFCRLFRMDQHVSPGRFRKNITDGYDKSVP